VQRDPLHIFTVTGIYNGARLRGKVMPCVLGLIFTVFNITPLFYVLINILWFIFYNLSRCFWFKKFRSGNNSEEYFVRISCDLPNRHRRRCAHMLSPTPRPQGTTERCLHQRLHTYHTCTSTNISDSIRFKSVITTQIQRKRGMTTYWWACHLPPKMNKGLLLLLLLLLW
jgi:hypothetical protein